MLILKPGGHSNLYPQLRIAENRYKSKRVRFKWALVSDASMIRQIAFRLNPTIQYRVAESDCYQRADRLRGS